MKKMSIKNGSKKIYLLMILFLLISSFSVMSDDTEWSFIVIPDTQYYSQLYPEVFKAQTKWIADNKDNLNIKFVLHVGDITQSNVAKEWQVSKDAMSSLDQVNLPYVLSTGNHDYEMTGVSNGNTKNRNTLFNNYFPLSNYQNKPWFGGVYSAEPKRLDSSYHKFEINGQKWLILSLEFGPRNEVITWANQIVSSHPDHKVILLTHAYLYGDNTRYDWKKKGSKQGSNPHSYKISKITNNVNDGEELWKKLVSKHKNFVMTFNGHVIKPHNFWFKGDGYRSDATSFGNFVHQMLVNYQFARVDGKRKTGYLRILKISDGDKVTVKDYSPVLNKYNQKQEKEFSLKKGGISNTFNSCKDLKIGIVGASNTVGTAWTKYPLIIKKKCPNTIAVGKSGKTPKTILNNHFFNTNQLKKLDFLVISPSGNGLYVNKVCHSDDLYIGPVKEMAKRAKEAGVKKVAVLTVSPRKTSYIDCVRQFNELLKTTKLNSPHIDHVVDIYPLLDDPNDPGKCRYCTDSDQLHWSIPPGPELVANEVVKVLSEGTFSLSGISSISEDKVLMIGDSHSAHYHYGKHLHNLLKDSGLKVKSYGIGATTSKSWFNGVKGTDKKISSIYVDEQGIISSLSKSTTYSLQDLKNSYNPNLVIISLGTNAIGKPENHYANYVGPLAKVASTSAKCYWVGPPKNKRDGMEDFQGTAEKIKSAVENNGCTFIDSIPLSNDALLSSDRIHYSKTGGQNWAQKIFTKLNLGVSITSSSPSPPPIQSSPTTVKSQNCNNQQTCKNIDEAWLKVSNLIGGPLSGKIWGTKSNSPKNYNQIYSGNYNPPVQTTKPKGGFTQGSSSSFTGPDLWCNGNEGLPGTTYQNRIKTVAWNSDGKTLEQVAIEVANDKKMHPALLASHMVHESSMKVGPHCTDDQGVQKSALTGCGWPGSCAGSSGSANHCSCSGSSVVSDKSQLQCTAAKTYLKNGKLKETGSYSGCNQYMNDLDNRWKCVLCVYVAGTPSTTCKYAAGIKTTYCKWKNYFDQKGVGSGRSAGVN